MECLGRFVGRFLQRLAVDEHSLVVQAMQKLPPKQAAALVLRHYHGYTNREIAAALDVPEQTVASRLAAARKHLQAVLGK